LKTKQHKTISLILLPMNNYSDDDDEEERPTVLRRRSDAIVEDDDEEGEEGDSYRGNEEQGEKEEGEKEEEGTRGEGEKEEEGEEDMYSSSDEEETDFDKEGMFRKIGKEMKNNVLQEYHPELQFRSMEEIQQMAHVIRSIHGEIIDPLHKTLPFLSKYEKARILGERARQLEEGAQPFVTVPPDLVDSFVIAEMELEKKVIPFILERPMPHGGTEYWRICDLEQIV